MRDLNHFLKSILHPVAAGLLVWGGVSANAQVVITNTPNGSPGGTSIARNDWKSMLFTTGPYATRVNSVQLGLNPAPLPITQVTDTTLTISLWSTIINSGKITPSQRIASQAADTYPTINTRGSIYTFSGFANDSSFDLAPNTSYGLTVSSDKLVTGSRPTDYYIRWSYIGPSGTTRNPPTALNGFSYNSFWTSSDQGLNWALASVDYNTIVLSIDYLGISPGVPADASNPYSTTLNGGTLIANTSSTFTTSYTINNAGGSIDTDGMTSTFSGVFSGSGALTVINSGNGGRTTLSGQNTYTGATTVANGATLAVNGSIAASSGLTVNSGGTIAGNGTLPATSLATGSTMAPGNSIGALTVNGNYSLNGGTLAIELQGPQNDQITVSGTVAPFTGTAALISYGGGTVWPASTYTILRANASAPFATSSSLTLNPSQITPSALLQLGTTLVQNADGNPNTFDVQWRPNNGTGATRSALQRLGATSRNTVQSAGIFDTAFNRLAAASAGNANASGTAIGNTGFTTGQATAAGLAPAFANRMAALLAITNGNQLVQALNSATPQAYAAFESVGLNALRLQRDTLLNQAGNCKDSGWIIKANKTTPLCAFALGGNATASINGGSGLSGYNSAIAGGFYGVELKPSRAWTVGLAYGYGTAALSNLGPSADAVSSSINSGSLYGVYQFSPSWSLKGLLGYGGYSVSGRRNLIAIGNGSAISGNTNANGTTAALLVDTALPLSQPTANIAVQLKPSIGLAYGAYQQNGFAETGDPAMNLSIGSHTSQSLIGTIGSELSAAIPLNSQRSQLLKPRLAIAYQVDALANTSTNTSVDATQVAAGSGMTAYGQSRGVNDLSLTGSLEYSIAEKASLYASASYETFSTGQQFAYGGGIKLSF